MDLVFSVATLLTAFGAGALWAVRPSAFEWVPIWPITPAT